MLPPRWEKEPAVAGLFALSSLKEESQQGHRRCFRGKEVHTDWDTFFPQLLLLLHRLQEKLVAPDSAQPTTSFSYCSDIKFSC